MTLRAPRAPAGPAVGAFLLGEAARAALRSGDLRRADRLAREAVATAEPLGDLHVVGHARADLASITGLRGDLVTAGRIMRPVLVAAAGTDPELLRWFALVPATLHLWAGDDTAAVHWSGAAARFGGPGPGNRVVAQALPGLATALRRLGRPGEARALAGRAERLARALDLPQVLADALDERAALAPSAPVAARLHHEALDVRVAASLWTFVVDSYDALAALAAPDDPLRAARLVGFCDAARDRAGRPRPPVDRPGHTALRTRLRDALGDTGRAAATAEGAAASRADLHAYLDRGRPVRRSPASGRGGLTRAEREVVALVVEGLTNPQIGARLFMSRSTVKTHLAHVFGKLGVTGRAELAAVAVRTGACGPVP